MRTELDWQQFGDNGLNGMETFIDDIASIHIVKYDQGEGFHWIIRDWRAGEGKCAVTGSYDFPETENGWGYLSDAYRDVIEYAKKMGILNDSEAESLQEPGGVKRFLNKAIRVGFATVISLSAFVGSAAPGIAYADNPFHNEQSTFIELSGGEIGVFSASKYAEGATAGIASFISDSGVYQYNELHDLVGSTNHILEYGCEEMDTGLLGADLKIEAFAIKDDSGITRIMMEPDDKTKVSEIPNALDMIESMKNIYTNEFENGEVLPITFGFYNENNILTKNILGEIEESDVPLDNALKMFADSVYSELNKIFVSTFGAPLIVIAIAGVCAVELVYEKVRGKR